MQSTILNVDTSLLLIIDIQEKLLNAQFAEEKIVKNASILAEAAVILGMPVVISEQYPKGLGSTIQEIKTKLPQNTTFFEKINFDCCLEAGFNELVTGIMR